jgi:hypothetical protein
MSWKGIIKKEDELGPKEFRREEVQLFINDLIRFIKGMAEDELDSDKVLKIINDVWDDFIYKRRL